MPHFKEIVREEILEDVQWFFLLASSASFLLGILFSFSSSAEVVWLFLSGAVDLVLAFLPFFWVRFAGLVFWTGSLFSEVVFKFNFVALVFAFVGVYYICCLFKCRRAGNPAS